MTMPDSVSDAAGAGVAGKPRDVNYDLLRVVAMCLVIGVHVINNYMPVKMALTGGAETVRSVLFALFMVCNPLFIMVSGRFNLTCDAGRLGSTRSSGNLPGSGSDARTGGGAGQADPGSFAPYVRYYYKRFVSLIVPYLLYAGGMGFVAYLVIDHRSVGGAVSGTLFDLFSGYDDSVYWFVFMLAGFVLATPFLAAMMRAIGRSGAWLLVGLAAAEQICNLAGYPLTFLQSFPWRGLLVYYLLGFVLEYYPPSTRARRGLYALAPFALAWIVATPYLFAGQQIQVGRTLTVSFAVVVAAVFLFFRYDVHPSSARLRRGITWLAGYSYTVYLVHSPLSKVLIGPRIPAPTDGWSYAGISVLMFAATLLAALLFAVIADTVVLKPVQRLLRKVRL